MSKRTITNFTLVGVGVLLGVAIGPLSSLSTSAQGTCQIFPETGKQVCGRFLEYWKGSGGLAQQGLPLSNEFTEVSDLNGQSYTVQYFERAVFEKHPENQAPYDVLLSQLGTFQFKRKYPNGEPGGTTPPAATAVPAPTTPPATGGSIVGQIIEVTDISKKTTFRVEVTDVVETNTIPATDYYKSITASGKFVVVKTRTTNTGSVSGNMTGYYLKLKDDRNRVFDPVSDISASLSGAAYYKGKSLYTTIQPGLTENIIVVFDVAPDAKGYLLSGR